MSIDKETTITTYLSTVPECITSAFYQGSPIVDEQVLTGGIVNTTLLVTDAGGEKSILQKLGPQFDETLGQDFEIVTNHLRDKGWETPVARKTPTGSDFETDESGALWRSFSYIESDPAAPAASVEITIALSGLLGRFHRSLKDLPYKPVFKIPHFHDTKYHVDTLERNIPQLEGDAREIARRVINRSLFGEEPETESQLIHGDPKLTNALYHSGEPFTFIDYDTVMHGSPMIDLGDMLRSSTKQLLAVNGEGFSTNTLEPIIGAYYESAKPAVPEDTFVRQAIPAARKLSLELCARYLNDSIEDSYFDWDPSTFDTRSAHNLARAKTQFTALQALD